ncbi:MAG: phosphatidate cytidylyltransferase, partial [Saprospiraceae bacterium]
KTWEGFIGGAIGTLLVAIILAKFSNFDLKTMILLALICSIFGTYGDLYQSSVKREFGLKDSGNILPGHGGFWDRFDSFIYVWPFVLMVLYLNSITQIN